MPEHSQPQSRLEAIDLVRLLAMALMIQGHTLDALLDPHYQKEAVWYDMWLFFRGFTAPAFMMMSGFSFALATVKRWQDHLSLTPTVLARLRRFTFFVLLGYVMHFPVRRIRDLNWLTEQGWQAWLQVDVLQAIGVTLLALQALVWISRTPARFAKLSFGVAVGSAALAPFAWAGGWSQYLRPGFAAYVDGATGSFFPLLPWAAYVFLGAGLGWLYLQASRTSTLAFARGILFAGLGLMVLGFALQNAGIAFFGEALFWKTSPTLFLIRAGFVLFLLGSALRVPGIASFSSDTVRALSQESLFVYCVHVCLLYGSVWNPGLREHLASLSVTGAFAAAVALIAAMTFLALSWNRFKLGSPTPVLAVRATVVTAAALFVM